MRIISGSKKGKKLSSFEGDFIRPTTDRVKESIFNLIQDRISEARVLDVFSGTGALSFEALSRGALSAVCLDSNETSIKIIRQNCTALGFDEKCHIIKTDSLDFLSKPNGSYDLIFLDPPYNKGFLRPVIDSLLKNNFLSEDSSIVLERDDPDEIGDFEGLYEEKRRKYGRTIIVVYKKEVKNQ